MRMPLIRPVVGVLPLRTSPRLSSTIRRFEQHRRQYAFHSSPALATDKAPEELCRACGAPLNSTEAGPVTPAGIMRPELL